jgi:hypothetical protein
MHAILSQYAPRDRFNFDESEWVIMSNSIILLEATSAYGGVCKSYTQRQYKLIMQVHF